MTEQELRQEIEALCRANGFILIGGCESEGIWGELTLLPIDGAVAQRLGDNLPAFVWLTEPDPEV